MNYFKYNEIYNPMSESCVWGWVVWFIDVEGRIWSVKCILSTRKLNVSLFSTILYIFSENFLQKFTLYINQMILKKKNYTPLDNIQHAVQYFSHVTSLWRCILAWLIDNFYSLDGKNNSK